jgi:hypothetical protein
MTNIFSLFFGPEKMKIINLLPRRPRDGKKPSHATVPLNHRDIGPFFNTITNFAVLKSP